jgi:hypothetical protein
MTAEDEDDEVEPEAEVPENTTSNEDTPSAPSEEIAEMRSELDELREKVRARTAQLRAEAKARSQQTTAGSTPEPEQDPVAEPSSSDDEPEDITAESPVSEVVNLTDEDAEPELADVDTDDEFDLDLSIAEFEVESDLPAIDSDEEFNLDEVAQTVEDELTDIEPEHGEDEKASTSEAASSLTYDVNIIDERKLEDESIQFSAMYPTPGEDDESPMVDAAEQATSDVEQYFSEDKVDEPVNLVDPKSAVSDMWQDLTEEPLPSDDELDQMFKEIKDLEKSSDVEEDDDSDELDAEAEQQDRLQSILSSIPSFSQMNKKKDDK